MIELVRLNGPNEANVVRDFGQMLEHICNLKPRLPMLCKFETGTHHGGVRPNESVALSHNHRLWQRFSLELSQLGLVVEKIEMAWRSCHEQMDDCFGFTREMRLLGCKWIGLNCIRCVRTWHSANEQASQCRFSKSNAAFT